MGIPDQLTCLLRNLYVGQEATVRSGHGTTDWFQIRKGVPQGCILSPCLFNLYAEYIRRNARLDEAQAGIKIAGRNINNLRYAEWTSPVAQTVKHLSSMWETRNRSLGWEDLLEKEMATHSSILARKILWTGEPGHSPWSCKESDTTERLHFHSQTCRWHHPCGRK